MRKLGPIFIFIVAVALYAAAAPEAAARGITLAWNANSEPDIAGYILYERVGVDYFVLGIIAPTPQPSYVIIRLSKGTHYYSVTAYNTAGEESDYSAEVAYQRRR